MKNYYLLLIGATVLIFSGFFVLAQELPGVSFPVVELGNCGNRTECEAYCDLPENMEACLDFGGAHGLISPEEAAMARKMLALGLTAGPGGCRGKTECEAYCDDISHIEECIAFAEKYGLIPSEELAEGKKVVAAIKQGVTPPNCKNKTDCDVYCMAPENMEECLTFGEAAGLIPPEELADAKKALEALKKGAKPPPCRGKAECDEYCSTPERFEECLTFAETAGFVSPEEAAMARKTGGKGPGNCRGKEECEKYCDDPAHMEECINFGEEFGFMSHEEAEQARKMLAAGLTAGPGGCQGKEKCEVYCNDLAHQEECMDFAVKAGFLKPEEAEIAKKMAQAGPPPGNCKGKEECDAYCKDTVHVEECLAFAEKAGIMPPEEIEQARKGMEMMQRGGPGGCKSETECKAYCQNPTRAEECINFAIKQGIMSPEEAQQIQQQIMQMQQMQPMQPPEGTMPPAEGMVPPQMPSQGIQPPQGTIPPGEVPTMPPSGGIAPPQMPPQGMMPPGGMPQQPPPPTLPPPPPPPPGGAPPSGGAPSGEAPPPPPPP